MIQQFFTVKEVATVLNVCELTVYRMIKAGKLRTAPLIGDTRRISQCEIDRLSRGEAISGDMEDAR